MQQPPAPEALQVKSYPGCWERFPVLLLKAPVLESPLPAPKPGRVFPPVPERVPARRRWPNRMSLGARTKNQMSLGLQVQRQMSLVTMKLLKMSLRKKAVLSRLIRMTMALTTSALRWKDPAVPPKSSKPQIRRADGFRTTKLILYRIRLEALRSMMPTISVR